MQELCEVLGHDQGGLSGPVEIAIFDNINGQIQGPAPLFICGCGIGLDGDGAGFI